MLTIEYGVAAIPPSAFYSPEDKVGARVLGARSRGAAPGGEPGAVCILQDGRGTGGGRGAPAAAQAVNAVQSADCETLSVTCAACCVRAVDHAMRARLGASCRFASRAMNRAWCDGLLISLAAHNQMAQPTPSKEAQLAAEPYISGDRLAIRPREHLALAIAGIADAR